MANNYADLSTGTVLTAPSPPTTGTSLVLNSGEGGDMPSTPFYATVHPDYTYPTNSNAEIVEVTNVSTDTLTIVRAQKSTTAKSVAVGWRLSAGIYAADVERKRSGVFTDPGDDALTGSYAILPLTVEEYNPESWTLSSNRVTPGEAGLYLVMFQYVDASTADGQDIYVKIVKNGGGSPVDLGDVIRSAGHTGAVGGASGHWLGVLTSTDTLELQAQEAGTATISYRRLTIIRISD